MLSPRTVGVEFATLGCGARRRLLAIHALDVPHDQQEDEQSESAVHQGRGCLLHL